MNPFRAIARRAQSWWSDKPQWGAWSALVPGGPTGRTGIRVTPESALTLTAAYAAINVIATDLASLPLKVYRQRRGGGRDEVRDIPQASLLGTSPDGETTSLRWRQAIMGHVLGWGNGYAEIDIDPSGSPQGLYILDPAATTPERVPQNRRLFYRVSGPNRDLYQTLPPYRVLHFAGIGYDGLKGYSPITLAREAVALGLAAEGFGATFFGNGTWPGLVLESPQKLSKEAQANLREQWESLHRGGDNAHKVAVLEMGMKASRVTISPEDAQFLESRKFQVVEIARIFRLPPHKIGDYSQSHLANIESSNLDYITTVLMPWCVMIEQELNAKLFTTDERAQGFYCEHQMTALLRGDMRSRAEFYAKMRDLGAISPNEIREKENLDPIDGGDVYLVPMNMTVLSMIEEQAKASLDKAKAEAETAANPPEPAAPASDPAEPDATDTEGVETKPARSKRANPNHGENGQFVGGGGGSGGGGDMASHPDVVDLKKDHASQLKEMDADYAKQKKQLGREQGMESKQLDREQAREVKEQARDQQKESKRLAKDQQSELSTADPDDVADLETSHANDRDSLAESHKMDREALAEQHGSEKQGLADDHKYERDRLEEEHADAIAGLKRDHAEELQEVTERLRDEQD